MTKYAETKSKGNPEVFLSVMNAFLVQQGIPQIVAPVCQVKGSSLKINAQTSPTRPVEIIQSYVLPVSPPPPPLPQVESTTLEESIQNCSPHTPTSLRNSISNTPTNSKGETTDNQTDVRDTNSEASVNIEASSPSPSLPSSTPTRKHIRRSHSTPSISPYHQSDDAMSQLIPEGTGDSNESPPFRKGLGFVAPIHLEINTALMTTKKPNFSIMGIKVLLVNIQHWDSNHYFLKCSLSNSNPDVILLNELSLKPNSIPKITGYKCIYKCPERYTGVAIFVKYIHKHFFIEFDNDHILAIRLFINLGPINIVTCYTPQDLTTILQKKLIKFWILIFLLC